MDKATLVMILLGLLVFILIYFSHLENYHVQGKYEDMAEKRNRKKHDSKPETGEKGEKPAE